MRKVHRTEVASLEAAFPHTDSILVTQLTREGLERAETDLLVAAKARLRSLQAALLGFAWLEVTSPEESLRFPISLAQRGFIKQRGKRALRFSCRLTKTTMC